jgi:hypothetical protein
MHLVLVLIIAGLSATAAGQQTHIFVKLHQGCEMGVAKHCQMIGERYGWAYHLADQPLPQPSQPQPEQIFTSPTPAP